MVRLRKPYTDRALFVHYTDELSRDERETLIREYRAEGWKQIVIREFPEPVGAAFKRRYEVQLAK